MTRTWIGAPSMEDGGLEHWDLTQRCDGCGGPRLPNGRCVVSGHISWCESSGAIDVGERWGWTPQLDRNRQAKERVREGRREDREVLKEPQP